MKLIMNYEVATKNIRAELKSYIKTNKIQSLVIGISGGIDSTLCALLARPVCDELNIPLIGRSLPASTNSNGENSRAKEIGELFCTDFKEVGIQSGFVNMSSLVYENVQLDYSPHKESRAIQNGNIKARVRMIYLYDLASTHKGMVLSTDNYTELLLGFWTLHGDVGDYGMIQNLWKTEVYEMTEWIMNHEGIYSNTGHNILNEKSPKYPTEEQLAIDKVLKADATDGLGISDTDLDQILPEWEGSSRDGYAKVDQILKDGTDLESPVIQRKLRTEFKRLNPVNIPWTKIMGIPNNVTNK